MKMLQSHYNKLSELVNAYLLNNPHSHRRYTAAGLSDERWRWDLLWSSGFDTRKFYSYLKDSHIDTALRQITNTT